MRFSESRPKGRLSCFRAVSPPCRHRKQARLARISVTDPPRFFLFLKRNRRFDWRVFHRFAYSRSTGAGEFICIQLNACGFFNLVNAETETAFDPVPPVANSDEALRSRRILYLET
jgi:hypothetical protein